MATAARVVYAARVVDAVVVGNSGSAPSELPPDAVIAQLCAQNAELAAENARLKHHLELLRRRVFGRRRPWRRRLLIASYLLAFVAVLAALYGAVDDIRSQPATPRNHTHDPATPASGSP